jgi:hypothetical protein
VNLGRRRIDRSRAVAPRLLCPCYIGGVRITN